MTFSTNQMLSMDHLAYKKVWLGMGVLVVVAVVTLSIFTVPRFLVIMMKQDKLMHTLAYFCLMAWFAQIFRHWFTRLILAIGLMCFGLGMECVQAVLPTRQFDVIDMLANCSGVVMAWALAYTWVGNMFVRAEEFYIQYRDLNLIPVRGSELT